VGTTEEDRKWRRIAIGGGLGLVVIAGMTWWLTPEPAPIPTTVRTVQTLQTTQQRVDRKVVKLIEQDVPSEDGLPPLDEDPNIEVVTPKCRTLVTYERRGVPQFTVLDTLRDQAMVFTEQDLGCLTAAGASPAILDLAESRIDYNALRGIKGKPGRDLTNEHETYFNHPRNRDK
jgi:hypothetical protein